MHLFRGVRTGLLNIIQWIVIVPTAYDMHRDALFGDLTAGILPISHISVLLVDLDLRF